MDAERYVLFPPFRLDTVDERIWRGSQTVVLRRKTFAVLRYLVERPDQLVTKRELLDAVWPNVYVSDIVLKVCMRELRKALGDAAKTPQFIETVHGRGYRFIAEVGSSQHSVASRRVSASSAQLRTDNWQLTTSLVGRAAELMQLHDWLDKALQGKRQIVFVTGEPGIGKTTVVEAFLQSLESKPNHTRLAHFLTGG